MSDVSTKQSNIIHAAFVLDASSSMTGLAHTLIKVVDGLTKDLADHSQAADVEVRGTVYTFNSRQRPAGLYNYEIPGPQCVFFDKDVLRLPSIKDHYRPERMTALIDATLLAISDLKQTAQMYGEHNFIVYLFTDGEENDSAASPRELVRAISELPETWTMAAFVPHATAKIKAQGYGFPTGNIQVWDATTTTGVETAGRQMSSTAKAYVDNVTSGTYSGTKSLFSTGADALNTQTVTAAGLQPVDPTTFMLVPVIHQMPIQEFVESCGMTFHVGRYCYELNKSEKIQSHKVIYVQNKKTGEVFGGPNVRSLLNVPVTSGRLAPTHNPDWRVFVQSTSVNRNLMPSTHLMVLKNHA